MSDTISAMQQEAPPKKAYLALGLAIAILGFSAIITRLADAPGTVTAFYRMFFATVFLTIPFAIRNRRKITLPRKGIYLAVIAGVFFGADVAAWASGIVLSGATLPTLFANTNPLWVGLGAMLLFKEKLSSRFWIAMAIALFGTVLILGADLIEGAPLNEGALLGLLGGVFYGIYFLVAQGSRSRLDAISFIWIGTLSSAIFLLFVNLILKQALFGFPPSTWIIFILQGLVIQAAGWMLISYAQGYLPASLISPTLLGQPVLTAFLAGPILGESLRSTDIVGGLTVILGIYLVHRSRYKERLKINQGYA